MKKLTAAEIMASLNLTIDPNMPDEPAVCDYCHNAGWVLTQDKKPLPCPRQCEASRTFVQRQAQIRYSESQLPQRYQGLTFKTWAKIPLELMRGKLTAFYVASEFARAEQQVVSLHHVIERIHAGQNGNLPDWMRRAAAAPDMQRRGFILSGMVGTGKTGLCVSAMNDLLSRGVPVLYVRVLDTLKALSQTWQDGGEKKLLDTLKTAPVLFLDDFGMDIAPADHQKAYMQIIARYRHGNNLPTMITTNLNQTQFTAAFGAQTTDPLYELCHWVPVGGEKLRNTTQPIEEF